MKSLNFAAALAGAILLSAVAAPSYAQLKGPAPIEGSTGKYMSPYTSDGVTAAWVTKSMQVKAAGQIGSMAGNYAGQKAMEQVPFVGGYLGKKAGAALGRSAALQAIGGEAFLRSTSDLSFNTLQELAQFIYLNFGANADFNQILKATYAIYPELESIYPAAVSGL
jgi:hypothetical protein